MLYNECYILVIHKHVVNARKFHVSVISFTRTPDILMHLLIWHLTAFIKQGGMVYWMWRPGQADCDGYLMMEPRTSHTMIQLPIHQLLHAVTCWMYWIKPCYHTGQINISVKHFSVYYLPYQDAVGGIFCVSVRIELIRSWLIRNINLKHDICKIYKQFIREL